MPAVELDIPGVFLLTPVISRDERGFFCVAAELPGPVVVPGFRDCMARSAAGVIRGLHVRSGDGEEKLVRCTSGVIYDVIVDLRPDSPAYKTWVSVRLSGASQASVQIPAGCAHGYQVISGPADVLYYITGEYDPAQDLAVAHDDPELGITWPLPVTVMSARDRDAPPLAEVVKLL